MSIKGQIGLAFLLCLVLGLVAFQRDRYKHAKENLELELIKIKQNKKLDSLDIVNTFLYTFVRSKDTLIIIEKTKREKIIESYVPIYKDIANSDSQLNITFKLLSIHRRLDTERN